MPAGPRSQSRAVLFQLRVALFQSLVVLFQSLIQAKMLLLPLLAPLLWWQVQLLLPMSAFGETTRLRSLAVAGDPSGRVGHFTGASTTREGVRGREADPSHVRG